MATLTAPAAVKDEVSGATSIVFLPAASRERSAVVHRLGLTRLALTVTTASTIGELMHLLARQRFALCLVDLADERGAVPAIRAIHAQYPLLSIAGLLDPAQPLVAADAIHAGVLDLLCWPFEERDVAAIVSKVRDEAGIVGPRGDSVHDAADEPIFAHSTTMRLVMDQVRSAASERGGVLICGEPGAGRSLIARALHAFGPNATGPFVVMDCGIGTPEAVEHGLFGLSGETRHNGANRTASERIGRAGAAFQARGGTLFLRNVVDTPARVQAKLARLIRDGEASLTDKRTVIALDWRAVAAADPGVESALSDGRLRRDFYERLAHTRLDVPALRRRREDVPMLALHVLRQLAGPAAPQSFSRSALALLSALPWPGNGRELRALIETLTRVVDRPVIQLDDVLDHVRLDGLSPRIDVEGTLRDAKARFERDWISAMLMKHHGRVGEAAKALGIQRTNLYRKVRQLKVARTLLSTRRSS